VHTEAGTPVRCAPYPRPFPLYSWSMRAPPCIASCPEGCQNLMWWARLEHRQESEGVSTQSALLCLPKGAGTSHGGAEAVPGAQMASCGLRPTRTLVVWPGNAALWRGDGMIHSYRHGNGDKNAHTELSTLALYCNGLKRIHCR